MATFLSILRNMTRIAVLVALLASCGQTGPLYLPDSEDGHSAERANAAPSRYLQ